MSIHFAPQWVKPIKPSGTSLTTTPTEPSQHHHHSSHTHSQSRSGIATGGAGANPNVPFPALGFRDSHAQRSASPTTATGTGHQQPLSYSRVTHTPLSPSFPPDASYFPYPETPNGNANPNGTTNGVGGHPFRYSREQILAVFDESKFKERPIELVEMAEGGAVLVSKGVNRPVGLREHTDIEKKLLASSVHPPMPARRQPTHPVAAPLAEPQTPNGLPSRRTAGFGRGEGGAFGVGIGGKIGAIGGGILSPSADGRAPGALGGGFGGVGKRLGRTRADTGEVADGVRSGPNWRPARTASGSFEGVLGFGNAVPTTSAPAPAPAPNPTLPVNPETAESGKLEGGEEKKEVDGIKFGNGGGPGWGTGQKKWRIAAGLTTNKEEGEKTLDVPISVNQGSASIIATPSATPLPDRDASILEPTPAPVGRPSQESTPPAQPPSLPQSVQQQQQQQAQTEEREDLGAVEWFYRDPNGQEQGPFTGTQMHDWYSHAYFKDDLPLRRASETGFQLLADLKAATGNAVQPFLSALRPRQLPPNLPIPLAALQQPPNGHLPSLPDAFRNLNLQNIGGMDSQFAPGYPGVNAAFSPNAYAPQPYGAPAPAPYSPSTPGQWNHLAPRLNNTAFGSIGMPSPIGQNPLPFLHQQAQQQYFSPQIGSPIQRGPDMFSPSVGVGAVPNSPWAIPQPQSNPSPAYHQPQAIQQPAQMQNWPVPEQQHQEIPQQYQQQQQPDVPVAEESVAIAVKEATPAPPPAAELSPEPEQAPEPDLEVESEPETEEAAETPVRVPSPPAESPVAAPAKSTPPPSVWGQKTGPGSKPASRKPSIAAADAPTPAEATPALSKLPPAPASLPAKPVGVTRQGSSIEIPKTVAPGTPGPTATAAPAKTAPWALAKEDKDVKTISASPSLREIQEAEAKQAEARRLAIAEARAASASPAPGPIVSAEDFPTSMAWGLPSQNKAQGVSTPAPSTPTIPAWGSGDAGPKKTLKQIQEEEEKRKAKAAQAARISQGAPGVPKRGYADLAATAAAPTPAGWSTIGAGGKVVPGATPTTTSTPASRVVTPASKVVASKPVTATVVSTTTAKKVNASNGVDENAAPSVEFIRWTKQALTGLNVNVDEFIQMLLTFPIDPPASSRSDQLEIISDSVYANSSTLDGRRFAQEFYTKRKADAATPAGGKQAALSMGKSSLADVVKSVPKPTVDLGFKVVKAKGKKK